MFTKEMILDIANANDVMVITFAKASGEITTRRTSFKECPAEMTGKGMRSFKDDQVNLFDTDKGNWITVKVANVKEAKPG